MCTRAINIQYILHTPEPHPTVETSPSSPALVLSPARKVKIYTQTNFAGSSEIDTEPLNLRMIHGLKSAPPHLQPIFPLPVEWRCVMHLQTWTFLTLHSVHCMYSVHCTMQHCTVGFYCSKKSPVVATGVNLILNYCYRGIFYSPVNYRGKSQILSLRLTKILFSQYSTQPSELRQIHVQFNVMACCEVVRFTAPN